MPNFNYFPNVPNAPDDPADDQPLMQTNSQSINSIIAVDHASFNNLDGGYHTVIHQVTQGADPAPVAGVNQVYSKLYTPDYTGAPSDTQLYNLTGGGGVSQLTGNSANSDGWVWSGGLLFQWGFVAGPFNNGNTNGTVIFKDRGVAVQGIPFITNIFNVQATLTFGIPSSTTAATVVIRTTSISTTQFNWVVVNPGASGVYTGFFWTAIGN